MPGSAVRRIVLELKNILKKKKMVFIILSNPILKFVPSRIGFSGKKEKPLSDFRERKKFIQICLLFLVNNHFVLRPNIVTLYFVVADPNPITFEALPSLASPSKTIILVCTFLIHIFLPQY